MATINLSGVSVILPTLNEAGNISELLIDINKALQKAGIQQTELLVVDDDSTDRTWEVAERVTCSPAEIRVIRRMTDHGLTQSIKEGISSARYDIILWLDCDFSHPPEYIPQLLFMIEQGFDVAVNSRYTVGGCEVREGKGGFIQLALSRVLNWGVRFLLNPSFSDYTSGFVAVKRKVMETVALQGDYGEYFVDFIFRAMRAGFKVCELPFEAPPRRSGESKTGKSFGDYLWRGRKYFWTVIKLRWQVMWGRL